MKVHLSAAMAWVAQRPQQGFFVYSMPCLVSLYNIDWRICGRWLPLLFSLLFSLCIVADASAWGSRGHRIICYIAWQAVPVSVRAQIDAAANRQGYQNFAQSCVWADRIRSDPRFDALKVLHYVNVPRWAHAINRSRDCPGADRPRCVLTAISHYRDRWQNPAVEQRQRDQALMLLGHFVGDVHQPMHVSYRFDRGGNRHMVTWINNERLSLHRLWDSAIIRCANKRDWRALAQRLYLDISPRDRRQWLASDREQEQERAIERTIDHWATESLALTRQIYSHLDKLRQPLAYCQHFAPAAQRRLQMAAIRLASLIDD